MVKKPRFKAVSYQLKRIQKKEARSKKKQLIAVSHQHSAKTNKSGLPRPPRAASQ